MKRLAVAMLFLALLAALPAMASTSCSSSSRKVFFSNYSSDDSDAAKSALDALTTAIASSTDVCKADNDASADVVVYVIAIKVQGEAVVSGYFTLPRRTSYYRGTLTSGTNAEIVDWIMHRIRNAGGEW